MAVFENGETTDKKVLSSLPVQSLLRSEKTGLSAILIFNHVLWVDIIDTGLRYLEKIPFDTAHVAAHLDLNFLMQP